LFISLSVFRTIFLIPERLETQELRAFRFMICRKILFAFSVLFLPFFLLMQTSCEKFSGDQTIPAYLTIDSIYLEVGDVNLEGTASHKITDAWVYVDDNLVGAFQLPARFPVLKQGIHKISVIPGVKKDGIAATRITYPFYSTITQQINLVPDSTISLGLLKTTYLSTTKFTWKEAFENSVSMSLDTAKTSMVNINYTAIDDPLAFEGVSGIIKLDPVNNFFEVVTHNYFPIPSSPVYLEMNFNTNTTFQVGVIIYTTDYIVYQSPVLNLAPTGNTLTSKTWKKIYVDLTTTLNTYQNSVNYKFYFGGFKDSTLNYATVLVDNFKLVTR
jgi:hypothetical protein